VSFRDVAVRGVSVIRALTIVFAVGYLNCVWGVVPWSNIQGTLCRILSPLKFEVGVRTGINLATYLPT